MQGFSKINLYMQGFKIIKKNSFKSTNLFIKWGHNIYIFINDHLFLVSFHKKDTIK